MKTKIKNTYSENFLNNQNYISSLKEKENIYYFFLFDLLEGKSYIPLILNFLISFILIYGGIFLYKLGISKELGIYILIFLLILVIFSFIIYKIKLINRGILKYNVLKVSFLKYSDYKKIFESDYNIYLNNLNEIVVNYSALKVNFKKDFSNKNFIFKPKKD